MPATGEEARPRHVDNNGATRKYWLSGCTSEQDVVDWISANVELTVAGFPFADFSADESDEIAGDYDVEVNWGLPQNVGSDQTQDTIEYAFNFQAPGGHIFQSLSTVAAYTDPALGFEVDPDNFGGAINVVFDGGKYRVEGLNISPPNEVFKLAYRASNSVITGAYQSLVRSMCGKVNSTTFRGEPAGSLMLVRASGGRDTSGIWSIEFGFGNIENDTNIQIGDITVTQKDGFDLLWAHYGNRLNANANGLVITPRYVFVERVFKRADFNLLNLPA